MSNTIKAPEIRMTVEEAYELVRERAAVYERLDAEMNRLRMKGRDGADPVEYHLVEVRRDAALDRLNDAKRAYREAERHAPASGGS